MLVFAKFGLMAERFGKQAVWDGAPRQENFFLGLLAGVVAAVVGAVIWMQVTLATNSHLGLIALLIGVLVGLAVRFGGNGGSMIFGLIGGLLTLVSCFAGEILTLVQLGVTPQRDFYATLLSADLGQMASTIVGKMDAISYIIYGIGVYEGYKFSIRK